MLVMENEIKDRIKALRKAKGISQSELGDVLGVTQNAISLIEKGITNISATQIKKISEFFDVSADYIIFGIESKKDIEPIDREILKTIRDNKTLYGSLIEMMQSQKKVFNSVDNFERLAA